MQKKVVVLISSVYVVLSMLYCGIQIYGGHIAILHMYIHIIFVGGINNSSTQSNIMLEV